jgi:hypothetical protein
MSALADNADASFAYAQLDGGEGREERLAALLRPNSFGIIEDRVMGGSSSLGYDDAQELAAALERYGANAIHNITIDAIVDDPSRYDEGLDIYADVVRVVGEGDIPDVSKRAAASAFGLYLEDTSSSAIRQSDEQMGRDEANAEDFNRPDLVSFFQELGYDADASAKLGQGMSLWITQQSLPVLDAENPDQAARMAYVEPSLMLGAIEDGFTATGDAAEESHAGFVSGLQSAGTVLRVVGVAAIPATGGASLVLTGVSTAAAPFLNAGAESLAGEPGGPAVSAGSFETGITQELRRTLAHLYAEQNGLPEPQPGEYDYFLIQNLELDPVQFLDWGATDAATDLNPDEHWNGVQG